MRIGHNNYVLKQTTAIQHLLAVFQGIKSNEHNKPLNLLIFYFGVSCYGVCTYEMQLQNASPKGKLEVS